ncbi:MAG: TrmB family transcriptional regulator [Lachnospiraceae bacterium]|nr:TrmB family transcriptional regulator [Lachnospiraceae bacterium]
MGSTINDYLKSFGLTGQEAVIYEELLGGGEMTGYEVAKATGISRSNVYGALSALTDKGAAYLMEGDPARYVAVDISVFCDNTINDLKTKAEYLVKHMEVKKPDATGYVTIQGESRIRDKVREMLGDCRLRLYFMADAEIIGDFEPLLCSLIKEGKKVVLLTKGYDLPGAINYEAESEPKQVRLITDSSFVLTGTYGEDGICLYSGNENLVKVMKEALGNRISIVEIEGKQTPVKRKPSNKSVKSAE